METYVITQIGGSMNSEADDHTWPYQSMMWSLIMELGLNWNLTVMFGCKNKLLNRKTPVLSQF